MSIPAISPSASGRQPDAVSGPGTAFVPLTSARPEEAPSAPTQAPTVRAGSTGTSAGRFSVLNDFRYLTDSDQRMLAAVTGEKIEPGFTNPYSGEVMEQALAWLDAHGTHRADLRL